MIVALAGIVVGTTAAVAAPHEPAARSSVTVKSGDRYWVTAKGVRGWCTLAAVGRWHGQRVGLTAGHCGDVGAVARNDAGERIGRFVASVKPDSLRSPDHAFIRLDPNVTGRQTLSGISAPRLGQPGCKSGWGMFNQGVRCGLVSGSDALYGWSQIAMFFGDSGGPVVQGGKLVGITSGLMRSRVPGAFMVFGRADQIAGFTL